MTTEPDDLDVLRAALYRPGATDADRARYEAARGTTRGSGRAAGDVGTGTGTEVDSDSDDDKDNDNDRAPARLARRRPPRRRRRALAGVVAVAVIAAAVAAVLLTRPAPRPPYPTVASTPIALLGDPGDQEVARANLRTLFGEPKPFLGLYLAEHRTALSASLRTDSIAVDGRGTGPTTVQLAGIASPGQATGLMTVLLACDRSSAYSWVVTGPKGRDGRPTRVGASGSDCGGAIVTATFVPKPNHVPTSIRITVPKDVRVLVEVDLSKY